jgi:hypothetical protein
MKLTREQAEATIRRLLPACETPEDQAVLIAGLSLLGPLNIKPPGPAKPMKPGTWSGGGHLVDYGDRMVIERA